MRTYFMQNVNASLNANYTLHEPINLNVILQGLDRDFDLVSYAASIALFYRAC